MFENQSVTSHTMPPGEHEGGFLTAFFVCKMLIDSIYVLLWFSLLCYNPSALVPKIAPKKVTDFLIWCFWISVLIL